jgi:3-oxoacyl-[acyl-carrier-protein] synthase-3
MSNAETAAEAAKLALARARVTPKDIGMVVCGGCSPDECIPAEANRVAEELNIDAPSLDISAACSSFCAQLHMLDSMRPERLPDYVLLVNPENTTRVVNYADRSSCVLWGDASSAAIVSTRHLGRWKIAHTVLRGNPAGADKVTIPRHGFFAQQGAAVQAFAVRKTSEVYEELEARFVTRHPQKSKRSLSFIGHQANLRMLETVKERCEIDEARHFFNVDRRGNTGAAGAPSVLSENWDSDRLGDAVAMCVVGSGLTWAGALLEKT